MSHHVYTFLPGINILNMPSATSAPSTPSSTPSSTPIPPIPPSSVTNIPCNIPSNVVLYNLDGSQSRWLDTQRSMSKKEILLPPVAVMCTPLPRPAPLPSAPAPYLLTTRKGVRDVSKIYKKSKNNTKEVSSSH